MNQILLVQNRIFTAGAEDAEKAFFVWREIPPDKKVSVLSMQASS
jgi:hypothetical protein